MAGFRKLPPGLPALEPQAKTFMAALFIPLFVQRRSVVALPSLGPSEFQSRTISRIISSDLRKNMCMPKVGVIAAACSCFYNHKLDAVTWVLNTASQRIGDTKSPAKSVERTAGILEPQSIPLTWSSYNTRGLRLISHLVTK